jgi:hypothetical protein
MEKCGDLPEGLIGASKSPHGDVTCFLCGFRRKMLFPLFKENIPDLLRSEPDEEGTVGRYEVASMADNRLSRTRGRSKEFK